MKFLNNILKIAVPILILLNVNCKTVDDYDGYIGKEKIKYSKETTTWTSTESRKLVVIKEDKTKIVFWDLNRDGDIDILKITQKGKTEKYNDNNSEDKEVIEKAQAQYGDYLNKIYQKNIEKYDMIQKAKEERSKRGLEALSR